jgi:hypothetical protein
MRLIASCASALLANTFYSHSLRQHIACQFLLLSIITSCASALLANTRSSLLSHLVPVHCLPITTPLSLHLVSAHHLPNTRSYIAAPCASTLRAKFLFTTILNSSASMLLNYKLHPIAFFRTLS